MISSPYLYIIQLLYYIIILLHHYYASLGDHVILDSSNFVHLLTTASTTTNTTSSSSSSTSPSPQRKVMNRRTVIPSPHTLTMITVSTSECESSDPIAVRVYLGVRHGILHSYLIISYLVINMIYVLLDCSA